MDVSCASVHKAAVLPHRHADVAARAQVANVLEYKKHEARALTEHRNALRKMQRMWRHLAGGRVSGNVLVSLLDGAAKSKESAELSYNRLVELFPSGARAPVPWLCALRLDAAHADASASDSAARGCVQARRHARGQAGRGLL